MDMGLIAGHCKKTKKLDKFCLGFSINLRSRRKWNVEWAGKDGQIKTKIITVYSLEEAMDSNECLIDLYNPRGRLVPYFIET